MAKRLLILTDAPTAPLHSPRMRYLIVNLAKRGWLCTVAYEQLPGSGFTFEQATNIPMPYYKSDKGLGHAWAWLTDKLFDNKECRLYRLLTRKCKATDFDAILCSTFNTFPMVTAARLSQEWQLPLVADLRDIAEQWGESKFAQHLTYTGVTGIDEWLTQRYNNRCIRRRDKALRQASAITTVSPWHQRFMTERFGKAALIYNGYDEQAYTPKDEHSSAFIISYTGRIYDFSLRDPGLLFEALKQMADDATLPAELELHFYCETALHEALQAKALAAGISDRLHLHGYVSNAEVLQVLRQSAISLLLTNKAGVNGAHGIMTTKFFEALGVEKPVLCVRSDEECLAEVIRDTNAGVAATTAEEVKAFALDKYKEWQNKGFTRQAVNKDQKQLFTRQYQAEQFEKLLKEVSE